MTDNIVAHELLDRVIELTAELDRMRDECMALERERDAAESGLVSANHVYERELETVRRNHQARLEQLRMEQDVEDLKESVKRLVSACRQRGDGMDSKIPAIREVRYLCRLGLKEAKYAVDEVW